ncbi:hypothetical protein ABZS88_13760 [Streptomyces sp. NPDC005480]|uniref:hypothetical protein n=1 Tax=Streptomyces sp. NPDC005480 TaxID=3154880 RepID=UPI0033B5C27F
MRTPQPAPRTLQPPAPASAANSVTLATAHAPGAAPFGAHRPAPAADAAPEPAQHCP